jgi:hypothetical protein
MEIYFQLTKYIYVYEYLRSIYATISLYALKMSYCFSSTHSLYALEELFPFYDIRYTSMGDCSGTIN